MQLTHIHEMSNTHAKSIPTPGGFGQTKTVIYSKVNTGWKAVLLTEERGGHREQPMPFTDPHTALSWCQAHDANFMYVRASLEGN